MNPASRVERVEERFLHASVFVRDPARGGAPWRDQCNDVSAIQKPYFDYRCCLKRSEPAARERGVQDIEPEVVSSPVGKRSHAQGFIPVLLLVGNKDASDCAGLSTTR